MTAQEPSSQRVSSAEENGLEAGSLSEKRTSPSYLRIREFCAFVCRLLTAGAGVGIASAGLGWDAGRDAMAPLTAFETWTSTGLSLSFGLFLLASASAPWMAHRWVKEEEDLLFIQTAHGSVCLPTKTITDFLKREGSRIPGVAWLRANLIRRDGEVAVEVEVGLSAESSVPELAERIQAFVKRELGSTIGVRNVQTVHVQVRDLAPDVRPVLLSPFPSRDARSPERDRPS